MSACACVRVLCMSVCTCCAYEGAHVCVRTYKGVHECACCVYECVSVL